MHSLLNKLRIIATLQEGQKLDISNGMISIYNDNFINWLYRKWNRDSKVETIKFTGGGLHEFAIGANLDEEAYIVRKNSSAVELMRTQSTPFTLTFGDNGEFDLFAGAEVQLAQVPQIDVIAGNMPTAQNIWEYPERATTKPMLNLGDIIKPL